MIIIFIKLPNIQSENTSDNGKQKTKQKKNCRFYQQTPSNSKCNYEQNLQNKQNEEAISYNYQERSFTIKNIRIFTEQILPRYYKHRNYSSFVRQVNLYDFHKIQQQGRTQKYRHQYFNIKKVKELKKIMRKQMISQKSKSIKRDSNSSDDSYSSQEMSENEINSSNESQMFLEQQQNSNQDQELESQVIQLKNKQIDLQNRIRIEKQANQRLQQQSNRLRVVFHKQNLIFYQEILKILQNLLISQYNQQQISQKSYRKISHYVEEEKKILQKKQLIVSQNYENLNNLNNQMRNEFLQQSKFISLIKDIISAGTQPFFVPDFLKTLLEFIEKQDNTQNSQLNVNSDIFLSQENNSDSYSHRRNSSKNFLQSNSINDPEDKKSHFSNRQYHSYADKAKLNTLENIKTGSRSENNRHASQKNIYIQKQQAQEIKNNKIRIKKKSQIRADEEYFPQAHQR